MIYFGAQKEQELRYLIEKKLQVVQKLHTKSEILFITLTHKREIMICIYTCSQLLLYSYLLALCHFLNHTFSKSL